MLRLTALLVTVAPLLAAGLDCPAGFEDLGLEDGRCYHFSSNVSAQNLSWTPAFGTCETLGGSLLSVTDPLHFYPISVITSQSGVDAWTGLLNIGGIKSWSDQTPYDHSLDQFIVDPNSSALYGYIAAQDGLFHLADPTVVMAYICYVDTTPPPSPTVPTTPSPRCPTSWLEYNDHCYLFSEEEQYWTTAEHSCYEQGAELVSIHDSSLITFLLISAGSDTFWTGLQNEDDFFVWADGSSTADIDVVKPYLDDWETDKNCVMIDKTLYPGKTLVHEDCFTEHKYVCYKPATGTEDDGLDYFIL